MNLVKRIHLKFFIQSGFEYAAYLKRHSTLQSQGRACYIAKSANIPDPHLTCVGDNVWITDGCHLLCHDASVVMINHMNGTHLDRIGPIVLGDNVFLGNNVIVLPGITIGSQVVIGAGAVVTRNIPSGKVWAGNPARLICDFETYFRKIENQTRAYPWAAMLAQKKKHTFDARLEQQLKKERITYFFDNHT